VALSLPQGLLLASSAILPLFGLLHLLYTFSGNKLRPRDLALESHMRDVHMHITRQTTVWRAWIGFNASHSLGLILFGTVYGWLALYHPGLVLDGRFPGLLGAAVLGGYLVLAWKYWFSIPLLGVSAASLLYAGAFLAAHWR
jgi:hypothetical protein